MSWYSFNRIVARGLRESLRETRAFATGTLLDVGCGNKPYLELFADSVTSHLGIDLPPALSANKLLKQADLHADLRHPLPVLDCSIDTVLCTEVIEHNPEPATLMSEMHRVLKPGGHLILTAPQTWGLHEEPHDYYRFTQHGLRYLAEEAAFEIVAVRPRGGIWATVAQRVSSFLHYRFSEGRGLLCKLPTVLACFAIQAAGSLLDACFRHAGDTLGNTMVARRG